MANINKGKISSISENTARVLPSTASGSVSRPYTIPWYLRGEMGDLSAGMEVVFASFDDGTGFILARADGNWPGVITDNLILKGTVDVTGTISAANASITTAMTAAAATVAGVSVEGHTHTTPAGETGTPH